MAPYGAPEASPFGQHGADIIFADLLQQGIFHEQGQNGKVADDIAEHRQKHVMNNIFGLAPQAELCVIIRGKPGQGENIPQPFHGPGKQHLQHHAKSKGRNGISYEHHDARNDVEGLIMAQGFDDAQGDAHQIGKHKPGYTENQRYPEPFTNQLPGGLVREPVRLHPHAQPIGDQVSEIAVLSEDYRDVEEEYRKTLELINDGVEVQRWTDLDRFLGTMLGVMDGFVLVWIIVIFLALSFGLVNTLMMAVFERIREFGLMQALGMKPATILYLVLLESLLLLALGLLLGNLLAWGSVWLMRDGWDLSAVAEGMEMFGATSVLYPALKLKDLLLANVVVMVLGVITSLLPAWRASRYQPVEAISKT